MRTLIVSDLHLGGAAGVDLLRRPELRAQLLEALADVDRLVLLGDLLELRHGPRREALAAARPFFEALGRAFAGREIVAVAGNHDHALIEPWLEHRSELPAPAPLGVEQRIEAGAASSMMALLAEWSAPARLTVAYPGLWVRPDVYATHGHYLDCHLTIPTLERLGIGAMGRLMRRPARAFIGPDDYEAVTVPVFAWIDAVARQAPTGDALNGGMTVRAWRALGGAPQPASSPAATNGRAPNDPTGGRIAMATRGGIRELSPHTQPGAGPHAAQPRAARAPSRSAWPRSTAPGSAPSTPTSPAASCAAPACARWARWPRALVWATPMSCSATPTVRGRCLATTPPSGAAPAEPA